MQAPSSHVSPVVQLLPSLHGAVFSTKTHPAVGSHVSSVHGLPSQHVMPSPSTHAPCSQTIWLHASLAPHEKPSAAARATHAPAPSHAATSQLLASASALAHVVPAGALIASHVPAPLQRASSHSPGSTCATHSESVKQSTGTISSSMVCSAPVAETSASSVLDVPHPTRSAQRLRATNLVFICPHINAWGC